LLFFHISFFHPQVDIIFSIWISKILFFTASCPVPELPNGTASYTGNINVDNLPCLFGICNVTYTCNAGFVLNGTTISQCVGNGAFVFGVLTPPMPTCVAGK